LQVDACDITVLINRNVILASKIEKLRTGNKMLSGDAVPKRLPDNRITDASSDKDNL